MNGIQSRKGQNVEKPFPGCLGRMVNLFDLNTGITGNRLLTDKPHYDGNLFLFSLLPILSYEGIFHYMTEHFEFVDQILNVDLIWNLVRKKL